MDKTIKTATRGAMQDTHLGEAPGRRVHKATYTHGGRDNYHTTLGALQSLGFRGISIGKT